MNMIKKSKKCPYCAEDINLEAVKCKHCGTMLSQNNNKRVQANQHPSYWAFTILGLLLPIVGVIIGIVFLTKQDLLERKLGEHTIAISILGFILMWILISMINFHV